MAGDVVPDLPVREQLVERLDRSIQRAARYPGFHYAVLLLELGAPETADDVAASARRLVTCLRVTEAPPTLRHDDLIAWLGERQFAVLLDGLKEVGHVTVAAERLLAELHPASIGIALSAHRYSSAGDVLRDAGTALQRAVEQGGARYELFDAADLHAATTELRLDSEFDAALHRGEFFLAYQPIASLASNRIAGFEALVRWQHPVLGLIAPLEFIPLAEKTGFIVPLGSWVLREACRQLKAWQRELPDAQDLWVSVNLSSLQFRDARLVDEVTKVLAAYDLEPRGLVLELTEGTAMEDPDAVRPLLLQLRAIGVRVSVDDFGTGHSSLAYLRQFPAAEIKIDKSFVRGIEANRDMASIVNAVATMARQLGLLVVAEGIEKEEQLGLLRALGCEFGQGYLFSRPVTADAALSLVSAGLPPRRGGPLDETTAALVTSLRSAGPVTARDRRTVAVRWLYVAAAGVILLMSIGLPRSFLMPSPAEPHSTPGAARTADVPLSAPPPAPEPVAPRATPVRSTRVASAATAPKPESAAPPASAAAEAVPVSLTSLRVLHQHRFGSCVGQLVVSREGVAFVPEEDGQAKDGFRLKYTQFLDELNGGSLRISSNHRDYRFRVAVPSGDEREQLERLAAAIARFR